MLAKFPTMVAPQNHDGIFGQSQPLDLVKNLADLGIGVADRRVVAMQELTGEIRRNGAFRNSMVEAQFTARQDGIAGGVLLLKGIRGQVDFRGVVEIPVFFRRNKGQVRLHKAYRQKKRLFFCGQFFQRGNGQCGDFSISESLVQHICPLKGGAP